MASGDRPAFELSRAELVARFETEIERAEFAPFSTAAELAERLVGIVYPVRTKPSLDGVESLGEGQRLAQEIVHFLEREGYLAD